MHSVAVQQGWSAGKSVRDALLSAVAATARLASLEKVLTEGHAPSGASAHSMNGRSSSLWELRFESGQPASVALAAHRTALRTVLPSVDCLLHRLPGDCAVHACSGFARYFAHHHPVVASAAASEHRQLRLARCWRPPFDDCPFPVYSIVRIASLTAIFHSRSGLPMTHRQLRLTPALSGFCPALPAWRWLLRKP
jgi:hypothetical protein